VPPLRERQDEIQQLIEFFTAKYAKRYNRREPAMTPTLLDALQNYSWPGNVRELENVIKRYVILQDEALLLRELQASTRRAQVAAAAAATAVAPERPVTPPVVAAPDTSSEEEADDEPVTPPPGENGHALPPEGPQSLAEVARQAMLKAERDLIIPTLRRVHWNRRKAAPLLGISYKTLLNKIKEQGIVQD
jgi:DNA-binding NtrC family response regulator